MHPYNSIYRTAACKKLRFILSDRSDFHMTVHVNANKTEYMCFNPRDDISTLNGVPLNVMDKFTYLRSNVSSTKMTSTQDYPRHGQLSIYIYIVISIFLNKQAPPINKMLRTNFAKNTKRDLCHYDRSDLKTCIIVASRYSRNCKFRVFTHIEWIEVVAIWEAGVKITASTLFE